MVAIPEVPVIRSDTRYWLCVYDGIWIDKYGKQHRIRDMSDNHLLNARNAVARHAEIAWTHSDEELACKQEQIWDELDTEWQRRQQTCT